MAIRYLDGKRLQRTFIAAANSVNARREHLNAINVFPVPDGDTGTNMAATLAYAADGIAHLDRPTLHEVREALGRAVLVGARGNSGFILAQFTRGFLEGIGEGARRLHRSELAAACEEAVRRAYEAISEPVEGTILTVMREWSRAVAALSQEMKDLGDILEGALERARHALEQTKEQMALLREHNVVDAGAQGFVHMLEGINEFLRTGNVHPERAESVSEIEGAAAELAHETRDLAYRYCTQALVEQVSGAPEELRARIKGFGDSLIVGGDSELLKIHIHTNDPDALSDLLDSVGTVLEFKAEDMQAQTEAMAARRPVAVRIHAEQTVAIVMDSTCDLTLEQAEEAGVTVVPCLVAFGDEVYRDQYDIGFDRFYELLRTHPAHPKTSMPAPADFYTAYESALGLFDQVISIHVSANFSGTYGGAVQAARDIDPERIHVVDSGTLAGPLGAMGVHLARCAREGKGVKELLWQLEEFKQHSRVYFMLETLEYLIRGGRISKLQGAVGKALGVRPVLTIHDGALEAVHRARGNERAMKFIFDRLDDEIPEAAPVVGVALHGGNLEMAERVTEEFTRRYRPIEMVTSQVGPAVGSHGGPGVWGVFYMLGCTT